MVICDVRADLVQTHFVTKGQTLHRVSCYMSTDFTQGDM